MKCVAFGQVFLKGEVQRGGLQPGLHPDAAILPAQGLRQVPDRHELRAVKDRGQGGNA